ncbi:MAG: hypothetical protein IK020_05300 [Clostridiales bacterium]|nr:hypothetical protein [Clostridiales bacterium]
MEKRSDKFFFFGAVACFLLFGGFELYRYFNYYIRPVGWVSGQTGPLLVFEAGLCVVTIVILLAERKLSRYLHIPWYLFCFILLFLRPRWDTAVVWNSLFEIVSVVTLTLLEVFFFFSFIEKRFDGKSAAKWAWFVSVAAQVLGTACAMCRPGRISRSWLMYQFAFFLALLAWMAATMPVLKKVAKYQVWVALASALSFVVTPWVSASNPRPESAGWVVVVISYARFAVLGLGVLLCSVWLRRKHNMGWNLEHKRKAELNPDSIEIPENDTIVVVNDE